MLNDVALVAPPVSVLSHLFSLYCWELYKEPAKANDCHFDSSLHSATASCLHLAKFSEENKGALKSIALLGDNEMKRMKL